MNKNSWTSLERIFKLKSFKIIGFFQVILKLFNLKGLYE
jgi:lipid A disaccharide synthetase